MELGRFYIKYQNDVLLDIISHITNVEIYDILQVCERYGEDEEDVRYYDVFEVNTSDGKRILKKADERELFNYEQFLSKGNFDVPVYYGKYIDKECIWILLENIAGADLRDMNDELVMNVANSLSIIQNYFWQNDVDEIAKNKVDNRFEVYWKRLLRRAAFVAEDPLLRKAYQLFLDRQLTCPRTLSNGDFLQFNILERNGKITIIDWGFGGVMPYSLDIARFIAHGTENRCTFPFYMTMSQKELFVNQVYKNLVNKPKYSEYLMDIKLAVFNEFIEFVEADEDENHWYYEHAVELAKEIVKEL